MGRVSAGGSPRTGAGELTSRSPCWLSPGLWGRCRAERVQGWHQVTADTEIFKHPFNLGMNRAEEELFAAVSAGNHI